MDLIKQLISFILQENPNHNCTEYNELKKHYHDLFCYLVGLEFKGWMALTYVYNDILSAGSKLDDLKFGIKLYYSVFNFVLL